MSVQGIAPRTTTSVSVGGQPTQTTTTLGAFPGFGQPRGSGVTPVEDYEARAAVHAIMQNGVTDMANWFRGVLFNPNNGDRAAFLNTPERVNWFKNLAIKDLISGIQKYGQPVFTGDSLKEAIRRSYYTATGVDAFRNIGATPIRAFSFYPQSQADQALVNRPTPDAMTPAGQQQISQMLGGGLNALKYNLWGHAASVNKVIETNSLLAFLRDGLTNRQSRDFGIIQGTPGGTQYVQNILNNPATAVNQFNADFVGTIGNLFASVRGAQA